MIQKITYLLLLCSCLQLWGQETGRILQIKVKDEEQAILKDLAKIPDKYEGSSSLNQIVQNLQQLGYIEANVDSMLQQKDTIQVFLHIGPVYEWVNLKKGNVQEAILSNIGFRERFFTGKPFNLQQLRQVQESLLLYMENNGYPFAEVSLTDILLDKGKVEATLALTPNESFKIDSLKITGDAHITQQYLENYLGIQKDDLYDESAIKAIGTRIQELSFLKANQTPKITFIGSEVWVELFLKKVKASKFDFLLGLLPNNSSTASRRYTITGEGQLNLLNTLGGGEELELIYKSYPSNATELKTKVLYPYLPFVPLGLDAKFDIYLRDSLYRDVVSYVGLQYNMGGANHIQFFFNNQRTSLLSINENQIIQSRQLPDNLDVSNVFYGIAFNYEKLDYRLNPRKGWNTHLSVAFGNKKIRVNNAILQLKDPNEEGFNFKSLYDSIPNKSVQYKATYQGINFFPIGNTSTFKIGIKGGVLRSVENENTPTIYNNERFRIGGKRVLRGFDEESIFVDWYNIATVEYRYLLGQNSNFFIFTEGSYLTNLQEELETDKAFYTYSFGAGINFETKAGIFGLSYALGSQKGNSIQVQNGKVHFGYINYF